MSNVEDVRTELVNKLVKKEFSYFIFVNPHLYKELLTLNIALPENKFHRVRKYTVYTKINHTSKTVSEKFYVNTKIAKALKALLINSPQFMFENSVGTTFSNGILQINGVRVLIGDNSDRSRLCIILFSRKEPWDFDELATEFQETFSSTRQRNDFFLGKIRHFNKYIADTVGYEDFVHNEDGLIAINPIYL